MSFASLKKSLFVLLAVLELACDSRPKRMPAIGEAFAGPATLKIRSDFPLQSPAVATVKHGDRLEILQRRRRFFRVRTPGGAEGWTDERQLLSADEVTALQDLTRKAAKLPVQGQATSESQLNIHTRPDRQSPSYLQVKENEKVDVLTHITTPRTDQPRKPLLPPPPKKQKAVAKKPKKEPQYPPPPMPKPPPAPDNWLELSKTELEGDEDEPPEDEPPAPKVVPMDDWSLVRTAGGHSGWALTRRLTMAIPDEVAQYAEGKRIVSYFSLGSVDDNDLKKNIWLWTTVGSGPHPYDFDSFRVFIWSLRRHRYETAYIERNVWGYAPVLVKQIDLPSGGRAKAVIPAGKYPGFSICLGKDDGSRVRREYVMLSNVVRYAGDVPCEAPAPIYAASQGSTLPAVPEASPPPKPSVGQPLKERLKSLTRRWFGH